MSEGRSKKRPCLGCRHMQVLMGEDACLYILNTGHMRPCSPGAECTEYITEEGWKNMNTDRTAQEYHEKHLRGGAKRTRTKWDDAAVERLLELKAEGLTALQIADRMGRTEAAINTKLGELRTRGMLGTQKVGKCVKDHDQDEEHEEKLDLDEIEREEYGEEERKLTIGELMEVLNKNQSDTTVLVNGMEINRISGLVIYDVTGKEIRRELNLIGDQTERGEGT